jgi:phospholipid-binding lipoprotein MlaA
MMGMRRVLRLAALVLILCAAALAAGCASGPRANPADPLEPFNRGVTRFNDHVDAALLKPVATAYARNVPWPVREGVSNLFGNLGDAWSAVNSLAQLKIANAAQNATRFAFNTVFGLGGVLDIAGEAGIPRHKEDFGSTLARWGVPAGPYLVLPLLGPSTLRDAAALPVDWRGDALSHVTPPADRNALAAARLVDARAKLLPLEPMLRDAMDRYMFTRDLYLQHRKAQIQGDEEDGQIPND